MRMAWIALMIVVAYGSWADSGPQPKQPERAAKADQNPRQQNQSPSNAPTAPQITITNELHEGSEPTDKEGGSKEKHWWENTAATNAILTLFTGCLVFVGVGQVIIYMKQKGVMERALLVNRRPRILVREMTLMEDSTDELMKIACSVVNAGDAPATVCGWFHDIQFTKLINWHSKPVSFDRNLTPTLKSGEHFTWGFNYPTSEGEQMTLAHARESGSGPTDVNLYLRGIILYKDGKEIERRTAMLRVLVVKNGRFRKVKGAKAQGYEYAD